jgi:lipid II:glycine glycyltransferase (peptidoglycan interpeptide bridge formation enzyme)
LVIETATSPEYSARLQQLLDESLHRTGGNRQESNWAGLIELSNAAPHLSRIAMLRRTDREGPESVLAFAHGCMHGKLAQYSSSGSTRSSDLKIPTSYALMWDLIRWARRNGARSFDLGGVTPNDEKATDPLAGISDFKRYFSRTEVLVGQQWELEPRPWRAALTRVIGSALAIARKATTRRPCTRANPANGQR